MIKRNLNIDKMLNAKIEDNYDKAVISENMWLIDKILSTNALTLQEIEEISYSDLELISSIINDEDIIKTIQSCERLKDIIDKLSIKIKNEIYI